MADALYQAAEQLAPSRPSTNFFDPAASQGVLSRWANIREEKEGLDLLDDAQSRIASNRMQRASDRRKLAEWDQDEIEHQDRQAFKAQRGEFLERIAMIDPNADDYEMQRDALIKTVPEIALRDDAVRDMLTFKDKNFMNRQQEADIQQRRREAFEDRVRFQKLKFEQDPRLSVLTAQERASFTDPETGEFDSVGASQLAYERSRLNKKEDTKEIIDAKAQAREALAEKGKLSENRKKVIEANLQDQDAFPTQMNTLVDRLGIPVKDIQKDHPKEYQDAVEYDKKRSQSEMASALSLSNVEDYVDLVPGADDIQKAKRREFWKVAHEMAGPETPAAPAQQASATPTANPNQAALDWLKANPDDPRAEKVKAKLGLK